jgi:hypothetical protein
VQDGFVQLDDLPVGRVVLVGLIGLVGLVAQEVVRRARCRSVAGPGHGRLRADATSRVRTVPTGRAAQRVGAENTDTSCDLQILVYQAAEAVSS